VIRDEHQILAPALLGSPVLSLLVLRNVAWKVAGQLGWPDTFDAEYVALTHLQGDALITLDRHLARTVKDLVPVAPIDALFRSGQT
jgi:predicted nucleic acid-binding protein